MNPASGFTKWLFLLTVVAVVALLATTVSRSKRLGAGFLIVAVWLGLPAVLALRGVLDRYDSAPPPALLMMAGLSAGTVTLAFSRFGTWVGANVGLAWLVGFQVFRVPVEWALHRLFVEGVIPIQMTYAGYNFDIVSGITAAAVGLYLGGGRELPRLVLAWNILGLVLLANIVIIAATSTPSVLRLFPNEPANRLLSTFPYVWLPSFLVQAALFGHLVVFRAVRMRRNTTSG